MCIFTKEIKNKKKCIDILIYCNIWILFVKLINIYIYKKAVTTATPEALRTSHATRFLVHQSCP